MTTAQQIQKHYKYKYKYKYKIYYRYRCKLVWQMWSRRGPVAEHVGA